MFYNTFKYVEQEEYFVLDLREFMVGANEYEEQKKVAWE